MRHHTDLVQSPGSVPGFSPRGKPLRNSATRRTEPNGSSAPALLFAGMACLQTSVFGQQPATISGFLADSSGAGVSGASLTLTNQDTALVLITNEVRFQRKLCVPGGPRAPAPTPFQSRSRAFTRQEQKRYRGHIGREKIRWNHHSQRRKHGRISNGRGPESLPFKTQSAERSANLDKHEIEALLGSRLELWRSAEKPSLESPEGRTPNGPGGNTTIYSSINGTRASSTIPSIDGVNAADPSSQGQLYAAPATDSLIEINVKTSNYQAEYGGSSGAVINLVTRSGTKEFHGGLYAYVRNEDLNANSFFNNKKRRRKAAITGMQPAAVALAVPFIFRGSSIPPRTRSFSSSTTNTVTRETLALCRN